MCKLPPSVIVPKIAKMRNKREKKRERTHVISHCPRRQLMRKIRLPIDLLFEQALLEDMPKKGDRWNDSNLKSPALFARLRRAAKSIPHIVGHMNGIGRPFSPLFGCPKH